MTFEVGNPYLFVSIPQINVVKIADLKACNASRREALQAFRSAIFTLLASFLLNICHFCQFGIKKLLNLKVLKLSVHKCLDTLCTLILDVGLFVRK